MIIPFCNHKKNQMCQLTRHPCEEEFVGDQRGGCKLLNDIANVVDSNFAVKRSLTSYTTDDLEELSRYAAEFAHDNEIIASMSGDAQDDTFAEFILEKVHSYLESYDSLPVKDTALIMATKWLVKLHDIHFAIE